jgi:integrase
VRGHVAKKGKRYYVVLDVGVDERGKRKQKWLSGFDTKSEAERGLTEALSAVDRGTYIEPSRQTLERYLLDEWLPACAARIRATTVESYRHLIELHVVPAIGRVPLAQPTPLSLTKFYGALLTNGRVRGSGGLSPRTVRYVHSIIRKALSDAVAWRLLPTNPCDGAIPPSAAAAKSPEMKVWNADQVRAFLDFTREDRDYITWHLAVSCGLRRGEVCGLRWSDLELDATPPTLSVKQQLVESLYRVTFAPPKTARGKRLVVLDPVTVAALRAHRRRQAAERLALGAAYDDHDLVVARLDGTPVHPNNVGQHFRRQIVKAGLPLIRFHDLRHTHATLALQAGIHPKIVSERLGHASTSFTLDVYSHATPSMQQQAADVMSAVLSG